MADDLVVSCWLRRHHLTVFFVEAHVGQDLLECIAELALNGDSRAIRKSFVTRECKSYISEMRNAGDLRAREVIRKWYQR